MLCCCSSCAAQEKQPESEVEKISCPRGCGVAGLAGPVCMFGKLVVPNLYATGVASVCITNWAALELITSMGPNEREVSLAHTFDSLRHQADTPNRSRPPLPLHCTIPGALRGASESSPPQLFLCMQRPTCMRLECLGACIVIFPRSCKGPSGTLRKQVPQGKFTLLGPDSLYQTSL